MNQQIEEKKTNEEEKREVDRINQKFTQLKILDFLKWTLIKYIVPLQKLTKLI